MKPLFWASPENYPQKHFVYIEPQCKAASWLCKQAKEVASDKSFVFSFKGAIDDLSKWDILLSDVRLPLVRRDALEILQRLASSDCQFLPTTLKGNGNETNEFFLLNITSTVDAIDLAQSEYKLTDQGLYLFKHVELLDDCMNNTLIARENKSNALILVHPSIKEEIHKRKVKGARFCPPSECGYARQQIGTP